MTADEPDGGFQRLSVACDCDDSERDAAAYPALCGVCAVKDRVLLNTTAQDLGLGTGGVDLVVARLGEARSPAGTAIEQWSGGHIMKLRYTPLQLDVLSVEEENSPHHQVMKEARSLCGMPVVCCGLHSQVPFVAAAVRQAAPAARVAYVMTDEATLALPMSDVVRQCKSSGLIDATVTCGQAFGGDLEAVNTHSGLLAAKHAAQSDVAVAAIGPGVAGTGTPFGHGGVAQGETINAAATLGGTPIAVVRMSFAEERSRHFGVSHHTRSALAAVALAPAVVALPRLGREKDQALADWLDADGIRGRHTVEAEDRPYDLPDVKGIAVTTMGRTPEEDAAFFASAAAAGRAAARRLAVLDESSESAPKGQP